MNKITIESLSLQYSDGTESLRDVSMGIHQNAVTVLFGPAGGGKSTLLRCLNRLNDLTEVKASSGQILIDGENILDPKVDVIALRRKVGMVFARPVPLPMSIRENIIYGLELAGEKRKSKLDEAVERSLKLSAVWDEVKEFWQTQPHKYAANVSLNCTGDFLANSKNCEESFNVVYSLDCKYIYDCVDMKDSQDCNISGHAELIYNCQSCSGFMNICCSFCAHSSNLYYCDHCFNCTNCFGCVGLTHQNYCIYNKQYSQEEYEKLIPRIIDQMKSNWGEFFPSEIAPISELDCVINDFFPASTDKRIDTIVKEAKVYPEVVDNKMQCIACNKDFLIIKQEQVFYQTHQLPFPPLCPTCRHRRRIQQRNPRILYSRKCNKCGQPVTSTFAESNPVQIYCEKCYQEAR